MASGADYFLSKTLGEDFFESLTKFELWKPGTKSVIDHEELKTALQIVPRTIMALLIRELAPMEVGDNHKVQLPVPGGATLNVTKYERDVYSGDINQGSKVIVDFKFRALPGVGLIIMSAFELYDMENLLNANQHKDKIVTHDYSEMANKAIQQAIDERMALHDLVGKVVDKKIMEKDAIHALVLRRLTDMMEKPDTSGPKAEAPKEEKAEFVPNPEMAFNKSMPEKKARPLAEFLGKRKKKNEYSVVMAKGEQVDCPDCGVNIFNGTAISGCVCLGDDMERRVFIKKEQDGIKVRFSKGWDEENIEMLLDVLRKKHG